MKHLEPVFSTSKIDSGGRLSRHRYESKITNNLHDAWVTVPRDAALSGQPGFPFFISNLFFS
jgi:hypothetical protein